MENGEYRTKDIGESAALYCSGIKLLRLDSGNGFIGLFLWQ